MLKFKTTRVLVPSMSVMIHFLLSILLVLQYIVFILWGPGVCEKGPLLTDHVIMIKADYRTQLRQIHVFAYIQSDTAERLSKKTLNSKSIHRSQYIFL